MKILKLFSTLLLTTLTLAVTAQQGINYKALIKDGGGNVIASQNVEIQFIIYEGAALTNNVYQETHSPNTDANGIIIVNIGEGVVDSGVFSNIDWASDEHHLNVQVDTGGGLVDMGTTQFMAVPYALYAKTAESITGSAGTHYLGEDFGGGIIYHLYVGSDGLQHGLIVNKTESTAVWQDYGLEQITNATRSWDGVFNTALMINSAAANYVNGLTDGGFTDWYLPSIDELNRLFANRDFVNKALNAGGFTLFASSTPCWLGSGGDECLYFSSTETSLDDALSLSPDGEISTYGKNNELSVRAIRAF